MNWPLNVCVRVCVRTLECFQASILGKSLSFAHTSNSTTLISKWTWWIDSEFGDFRWWDVCLCFWPQFCGWQICSQTHQFGRVNELSIRNWKLIASECATQRDKGYLTLCSSTDWVSHLNWVCSWAEVHRSSIFVRLLFHLWRIDKGKWNELRFYTIKLWTFTLIGCTISVKRQFNTINLKMLNCCRRTRKQLNKKQQFSSQFFFLQTFGINSTSELIVQMQNSIAKCTKESGREGEVNARQNKTNKSGACGICQLNFA